MTRARILCTEYNIWYICCMCRLLRWLYSFELVPSSKLVHLCTYVCMHVSACMDFLLVDGPERSERNKGQPSSTGVVHCTGIIVCEVQNTGCTCSLSEPYTSILYSKDYRAGNDTRTYICTSSNRSAMQVGRSNLCSSTRSIFVQSSQVRSSHQQGPGW